MLIGTHQKLSRTQSKLNISIKGEHLDNVDQFKCLGIWLDPSLSWSSTLTNLFPKLINVLVFLGEFVISCQRRL